MRTEGPEIRDKGSCVVCVSEVGEPVQEGIRHCQEALDVNTSRFLVREVDEISKTATFAHHPLPKARHIGQAGPCGIGNRNCLRTTASWSAGIFRLVVVVFPYFSFMLASSYFFDNFTGYCVVIVIVVLHLSLQTKDSYHFRVQGCTR